MDQHLAERIVQRLNGLIQDATARKAIESLIHRRIACPELEPHPTIQISPNSEFGVLGLLNGIVGGPLVIAHFDDDTGQLLRFSVKPQD